MHDTCNRQYLGILCNAHGTGIALGRQRPARGRAILLFQPAEETGAGAAAVIADPAFAPLRSAPAARPRAR